MYKIFHKLEVFMSKSSTSFFIKYLICGVIGFLIGEIILK